MYFLLLTQLVGHTGNHASVVGPMTRAQYVSRYGAAPPVGNANGYSNRLLATAAAAKYNANPQLSAGPPLAPNAAKVPGLGNLTNPLAGVNAIGDFFNRLTQPNTWVRVGEVGAGVLLIYLGLSATMRNTEVGRQVNKAKSTGKKLAAVVPK